MAARCSYFKTIFENKKVKNFEQCTNKTSSVHNPFCDFHRYTKDESYPESVIYSDVSVCFSSGSGSGSTSIDFQQHDMFMDVNEIETTPIDPKPDDSVKVIDPAIIITPPTNNIFDNVKEIETSPIENALPIRHSDTATTILLNGKELDDQTYLETTDEYTKNHHTILEDGYIPFIPKYLQLGEFSFNLNTPCNITFFSGPLLESFVVTRFQVIMIKGKGTDSCFFTMIPIVKDPIFGETVISREPPYITCQKASRSVIAKFESGLDEVVDFTDLLIYDDHKIIDLYAKSVGCNFMYNGKFYNYKPKNIMILSPISDFRNISF